jgi:hypothetical protein
MKRFSDLLDTEFKILISLTLEPITQNGAPFVRTTCNNIILCDNALDQTQTWRTSVDLLEHIDLQIELSDKTYCSYRETAVLIKSLMIDGFEIVPNWTHLANYHNERNITGPTSYLGFNGIWELKIDEPFYRWRHRITGQGWLLEPTSVTRD